MTTVVFETAALADALKRAERVSPRSGHAMVQIGGVAVQVKGDKALLRATDANVFLSQVVHPESSSGDCEFRLPMKISTKIVGSLPSGRGQHVTLNVEPHQVTITQGQMKATVPTLDVQTFPQWMPVAAPESAPYVQGFGIMLDRISWAASRQDVLSTSAVLVTSSQIVAATSSGVAVSPHAGMEVPEGGALVSLATVSAVLTHSPDVFVWFDGESMYLAPNEFVQVKCRLWDERFPNWQGLVAREFNESTMISSEHMRSTISRLRAVVEGAKKTSDVWLTIGEGRLEFNALDSEGGTSVLETVTLPEGTATHPAVTLRLRAELLSAALNRAPGEKLILGYDTSGTAPALRVDGEGGYACWVPLLRNR